MDFLLGELAQEPGDFPLEDLAREPAGDLVQALTQEPVEDLLEVLVQDLAQWSHWGRRSHGESYGNERRP